jgi:hypothetical protein
MAKYDRCQNENCGHYRQDHPPNSLCLGIFETNVGCLCREFIEIRESLLS